MLINDKGVSKTALATPDLLNTSGMKSDLYLKDKYKKKLTKAIIFKINEKQQW